MRRSEGTIANLSGTGEAITETATIHHRLHDPAAACRIMSTSSHHLCLHRRCVKFTPHTSSHAAIYLHLKVASREQI